MKVDLTADEIYVLHDLGCYALSRGRARDADTDTLQSAVQRLREAAPGVVCAHCHDRPRSEGRLCVPCATYEHRYGELPPDEFLSQASA